MAGAPIQRGLRLKSRLWIATARTGCPSCITALQRHVRTAVRAAVSRRSDPLLFRTIAALTCPLSSSSTRSVTSPSSRKCRDSRGYTGGARCGQNTANSSASETGADADIIVVMAAVVAGDVLICAWTSELVVTSSTSGSRGLSKTRRALMRSACTDFSGCGTSRWGASRTKTVITDSGRISATRSCRRT